MTGSGGAVSEELAPEAPPAAAPRVPDAAPTWRTTALVVLGYVLVLVVVAWPLVSRLGTHMYGDRDGPTMLWGFWWFREALLSGQWPFATTQMLAPVGTPLAFHTYMPLLALLSIPLQWLFGPIVSFHLVVLAAPLASALAAYALGRALRLAPPAAFVTGLAFGFAPSTVDRLAVEHLNLAFTAWLPLGVLAVRAALVPGRGRWAAVAPGVVLAAALWTDQTIALLACLVVAAYVLGVLWRGRAVLGPALGQVARALAPGALVAVALAAPMLALMARVVLAGELQEVPGTGSSTWYSADALSFLLPNPRHALLGASTVTSGYDITSGRPWDGTAALGLTILVLAAAGLRAGWRRPVVRWAALLVLVSLVLAVGPVLHVAGTSVAPMPFALVQELPGLEGLRAPVRFTFTAALGLAVLAGFGVARLTAARRPLGATLVVAALVAAESASAMPTLVPQWMPEPYQVIAADPEPSIVVDVPLGFRSGLHTVGNQQGTAMAWATLHRHPVATGFGSRTLNSRLDQLGALPLYRDLQQLQASDYYRPERTTEPDPAEGRRSAEQLGVRYVVVNGPNPAVDDYLAEAGFREAVRDGSWVLHVLDEQVSRR